MTTAKRKAPANNIPPDAFAMLTANPPTEEEKAQWMENMRQSNRDRLYFDSIREQVLAEHGDCWIAAFAPDWIPAYAGMTTSWAFAAPYRAAAFAGALACGFGSSRLTLRTPRTPSMRVNRRESCSMLAT